MSSTRRDFIGQVGLTSLYLGLGSSFPKDFFQHSATALPRSTPAAQGVDDSKILSFIHAIHQSKHEDRKSVV